MTDLNKQELRRLRMQVDTLTDWYTNALNVISECSAVLPGVTYMDPPDGGDVSIPEQLRRMAKGQAPKPNESGLWSFCANLLHNGVGTWKTRRLRA